MSKKTLLKLN